ncbi:MAG: hypothetical protein DSO02_05320, partial [Hadesarchaea archaeon]
MEKGPSRLIRLSLGLRRAFSLLLSLLLLSSQVSFVPVRAQEEAPPLYPLFENTENAEGVIRLLPGYTRGSFVSEILELGEGEWELWWEREEPSLGVQTGEGWVEPELEGTPENLLGEDTGGHQPSEEDAAGLEPQVLRCWVDLQVRVSTDGESWSEWMGPDGTPNTLFTSPPADLSFLPPSRYLQVRVFLRSEDPGLSGENGPKVWRLRAEPRHTWRAVVGR